MSVLNEFAKYDAMSTEELNEILRQDFLHPGDELLDADAILYISRLLAAREGDDLTYDTEASWQNFRQKFIVSDFARPDEGKTISRADTTRSHTKKKASIRTLRILLIAVVITAMLAGATYAAGILGWLPKWNSDHFSFSPVEETSDTGDCTTLEEALARHNAPSNIVPRYLPDGYEQVEFNYTSAPGAYTTIDCIFSDGIGFISLAYCIDYSSDHSIFTKDEEHPEIYTVCGIDHYIMTNVGQHSAVWQNGNFECNLYGFESREELIKTIDSMY